MKTIINNPNKLNKNDIELKTNKVRAIIIDNSNNIIITKYADMYMLPGGKIDNGEKSKDALIRELNEELGIKFDNEEITPFITFENYLKDYPIVNSNKKINKLNKTTYYIIRTDKKINNNKIKLTERENQNNFSVTNINLDEVINLVLKYESKNIRNLAFKTELINVLEEYKNYKSINNENLLDLEERTNNASANFLNEKYKKEVITPYKESEKIIDMHTHTCYSDGELTPYELIKLAIKNNIGTLAITDHDTLEGIKTIDRKSPIIVDSGIKIINGIELSAKVDKGRMHILGYDFDIDSPILNEKMQKIKDINVNYILSIIEQLKKDYNIFFTYNELKDLINIKSNLGRPNIARLLIKNGYVKTMKEAFEKYLIDAHNKISSRKKGIDYSECIDIILKSNGIPILAHPKSLELNDKEFLYLLKDMIKCGLMGIEVFHSSHTKEEIDKYLDIANEFNLLISGGSDYHGANTKPDIELGTGRNNNLKIKQLSLLDKIKTH